MPKGPGQGGEGPSPVKFNRSLLVWILGVLVALGTLTILYNEYNPKSVEISASQFWSHVRNGYVEKITVNPARIEGKLRDIEIEGRAPGEPRSFTVDYNYLAEETFEQRLAESPHPIEYTYNLGDGVMRLLPTLLYVVVLVMLIWFVVIRQLRSAGPGGGILGNFGRSRHRLSRKEHTHTTFDDVAGIQEAKDEVREIIEFLKNPKQFQRLGARIPRGILLVGSPGCGKTLLAKAIAGEADVPFFSISGSDFVEMFVGVGASRVRDLFKQAKDNAPCIIFLDEIDAVGRKRGMGFGGGHDEREQTLNAILVEMDGFDSTDQVIVIAATNRVDVLDPALTRPGRFDREIHVPLPDIQGRVEILKIYAAKVACGSDVDLQRLARGTPMFSGADLSALVNEAAIAATMAGKDFIDMADMEEARDKVRWGRARKSHVVDEREKRMTAYHEAGHALVQLLTEEADPLHKVSIIPRGQAGGATFSLPENDRHMYTRQWCKAFIRVAMAGRIAEEMFFNDIDSGAASDIHQATELARRMVMDWGMSEKLGFVRYSSPSNNGGMGELLGKDYSDQTAQVIDVEIQQIMAECETLTRQLIQTHRDAIDRLAQALLKYETLGADEVQMVVDGQTLDRPTVGDLLAGEQAKFYGDGAAAKEDAAREEAPSQTS
ncbi:MAG: ATP-dependent zinc metalloprotease FtsH [Planctomycetes bacterium]|nr:ATP-dependent zinc metalloprotease FtsH [Planctomycetota bacterium]